MATVSGTGTTDYRYYADGTRAEKIAPGNLTRQFYYMGGPRPASESEAPRSETDRKGDRPPAASARTESPDGLEEQTRLRLPGSVDEAFLMIDQSLPAGDRERWAHPNRLGSTIVISDSTGAVVDAHTYSPFGQAGEGDGGFPFRFTGQKLDPETGLYYYKARYYDPELGRFLQTDPIGYADQMNLYAYVANDPLNATDPTGEAAFLIPVAICAASPACRGAVGAVAGAAIGAASSAIQQAMTGEGIDGRRVAIDGLKGAAVGGVSAATLNYQAGVATAAGLGALDGAAVAGTDGDPGTTILGGAVRGAVTDGGSAALGGAVGGRMPVAFPTGEVLGTIAGATILPSVNDYAGDPAGHAVDGAVQAGSSAFGDGVGALRDAMREDAVPCDVGDQC